MPTDSAVQTKPKKKEEFIKNDLQERVCSGISKDYMDYKSPFVQAHMGTLEEIVKLFNIVYFGFPSQQPNVKSTPARLGDDLHSQEQPPSY